MKIKRDFLTYLEDMLDSVNKGILFTSKMTHEQFLNDDKTQSAVIRTSEIISILMIGRVNY